MTKKHLTPEQERVIKEAVRHAKIKMTKSLEKSPVTLPKLKFMEKEDDRQHVEDVNKRLPRFS